MRSNVNVAASIVVCLSAARQRSELLANAIIARNVRTKTRAGFTAWHLQGQRRSASIREWLYLPACMPRKRLRLTRLSALENGAMYYVYVLRSERDSGFYIGFSTNLRARLRQHQDGESFATKSLGPWKLIYYEAYTEREDAEGREKFLKSGAGRRFLRTQLRHYLQRFPIRVRRSDHASTSR